MRKKLLKRLLIILATPFVLIIVFLVVERVHGAISLAHYKRELIQKGEKLTPKDFVSAASNEENGAPELWAAVKQLKEGDVLPKNPPSRMKLTQAGHAIVGFREDDWVEDKVTNHWDQVANDLERNEINLKEIRSALAKPILDNHLDLSLGPKMVFPHLPLPKKMTQWFGARSQLALHAGRTHEALEDLVAEARLARSIAEDRILVSELVRIAIAAVARGGAWEALQARDWTDADLAELQDAWARQSFATNMARALEGEIIFGDNAYNMMRKSNEEAIAILFGMEEYLPREETELPWWERTLRSFPGGEAAGDFLRKQVYCRIWRFAWLDQDERRSLEHAKGLLDIMRTASIEKSLGSVSPRLDRLKEESLSRRLYNRLRHPQPDSVYSLSLSVKKAMRAETERSLILCAIALKRYSMKEGKLPASLDFLVPAFLPMVPVDYLDGTAIKYRPGAEGTFTLYSVGEDLKDNGGDTALPPEKKNFRNLWDRKDFVWPVAALPEEVEAYRKESAKGQ